MDILWGLDILWTCFTKMCPKSVRPYIVHQHPITYHVRATERHVTASPWKTRKCCGLLCSSTFQDTFLQKSCILSIEGAYVILQSPIDIRIPGADRRIGPSPPSPPAAVRCRNCTQWHMGLKLEGRKNGAWGPRKQTLSLSLLRRRFIVLRRTT